MRNDLEHSFRRCQTSRQVRDAEVLVDEADDWRQNGDKDTQFHARYSSSAKRRANLDEQIGEGKCKNQIGEDVRGHDLSKHAWMGSSDLPNLLAHNPCVKGRVQHTRTTHTAISAAIKRPLFIGFLLVLRVQFRVPD
jgi:hypothetical protein